MAEKKRGGKLMQLANKLLQPDNKAGELSAEELERRRRNEAAHKRALVSMTARRIKGQK